jgi:hypothetical protein
MNRDEVKGKTEALKGKIKQAAGDASSMTAPIRSKCTRSVSRPGYRPLTARVRKLHSP